MDDFLQLAVGVDHAIIWPAFGRRVPCLGWPKLRQDLGGKGSTGLVGQSCTRQVGAMRKVSTFPVKRCAREITAYLLDRCAPGSIAA